MMWVLLSFCSKNTAKLLPPVICNADQRGRAIQTKPKLSSISVGYIGSVVSLAFV